MKQILLVILLLNTLLAACSSAPPLKTLTIDFETGVDPDIWASIPEGDFLSGQHNHLVTIDYEYEIMVTDVTNAQFANYLNEALTSGEIKLEAGEIYGYYPGDIFRDHEHEEQIQSGDWLHMPLGERGLRIEFNGQEFSPMPGYGDHPIVMVTWFGAKAFCEHYGWRLPSEHEWEKAGRGLDGRPFPWGDKIELNNANFYSSQDIFEKLLGKSGDTTPVGFYNGDTYQGYLTLDSASPFGLYDMAGNVWQWTGDVYPDQHYRYMRGGSKDNYAYNLRLWTRNSAAPNYYSPSVGFRCARDG